MQRAFLLRVRRRRPDRFINPPHPHPGAVRIKTSKRTVRQSVGFRGTDRSGTRLRRVTIVLESDSVRDMC